MANAYLASGQYMAFNIAVRFRNTTTQALVWPSTNPYEHDAESHSILSRRCAYLMPVNHELDVLGRLF